MFIDDTLFQFTLFIKNHRPIRSKKSEFRFEIFRPLMSESRSKSFKIKWVRIQI